MQFDFTTASPQWLSELTILWAPALDLLLKSGLLVVVTSLFIVLLGRRLSPGHQHLLWLNALVCTALIPVLPFFVFSDSAAPTTPIAFDLITLAVPVSNSGSLVENTGAIGASVFSLSNVLLIGYLLICTYFLLKFVLAAVRVHRVSRRAETATEIPLLRECNQIRKDLGISRWVSLKFSGEITAPVSFGLFRPTILFPDCAKCWGHSTFVNAMRHELYHIARLDWLASAAAYLCCSVMWFNPFSWYALGKLEATSEVSCDLGVLRFGVAGSSYAEDLLFITRSCKSQTGRAMLAQHIVSTSMLKFRIAILLENRLNPSGYLKFIFTGLVFLTLPTLTVLSAGKLLSAAGIEITTRGLATFSQSNFLKNMTGSLSGNSEFDLSLANKPEPLSFPEYERLSRGMSESEDLAARERLSSPPLSNYPQEKLILNQEFGLAIFSHENLQALSSGFQIESDDPTVELAIETQGKEGPASLKSLTAAELRNAIAKTENEYYKEFNAGEQDKSLHIVCGKYRPTGTFLTNRYCEPRFLIDARSNAYYHVAREPIPPLVMQASTNTLNSSNRDNFNALTVAMNEALENNPRFRELHFYLTELKSAQYQ